MKNVSLSEAEFEALKSGAMDILLAVHSNMFRFQEEDKVKFRNENHTRTKTLTSFQEVAITNRPSMFPLISIKKESETISLSAKQAETFCRRCGFSSMTMLCNALELLPEKKVAARAFYLDNSSIY